jgi:proline dehydrogenase
MAQELGTFVRIDMEESAYTARTIELFEAMEDRFGSGTVGIAIQSYLRSRSDDLERLLARGSSIRLVKGGYWEPADVAYRQPAEIDAAFIRAVDQLVRRGNHPAVATHDPRAIARVLALQAKSGLDRNAFEFEMLYGVRRDLQAALARDGYTVRCYVPYGPDWYAYLLGCLRKVPGGELRRVADRLGLRPPGWSVPESEP